jgi:hypothetical protein
VLGIFRLMRGLLMRAVLSRNGQVDLVAMIGAWVAAFVYGANPNLIYMQSTAMGESLYLAFFIWAIVYFAEFLRGNAKALTKCGICLAAACLTRYDGWFLALVLFVGAIVVGFRPRKLPEDRSSGPLLPVSRTGLVKFVLLVASAPLLWLGYNAIVYQNPLEFADGPYSAKAIEQRTATVNPAKGNLLAAGSYFLKAAELDVAEANWLGRLWLGLALLGSLAAFSGRGRVALLLWVPLPFYALSIAYGSVPIFVPAWWPFSQYNLRYGLQLLPAFAVFVPLGIAYIIQLAATPPFFKASWNRWTDAATFLSILVLAMASYGMIWRADPICYREAATNMRGRVSLDRQLAGWIKSLPPDSTLLMYLGEHVGALEQAGVPLRRVINEGNHRVWKRPTDPEGLWERALADPASYADFVVGFDGDPVWTAAENHRLRALVEIHTTGQPPTAIFQGRVQTRGQEQTR